MQHIYSRSVISIKLLCSLVNLLQIFRIRFPRIISGWLLLLILSCSNVPLLVATDNPMSTKCLMFSHNKQPKIKFLGIKLGSTLSVENHVKKGKSKATCTCQICQLHRLRKQKCQMKAFTMSQFNYCPLVWMFHGKKLNYRINKIHKRAPRRILL